MNQKIEQLALNKDFAALTAAERMLVTGGDASGCIRPSPCRIVGGPNHGCGTSTASKIEGRLLARMGRLPNTGGLTSLWAARMPVWQAAAILLLGVALVSFLKKETVQERIVTEIQVRRDTVFQEKTIWRERVIYKERLVVREKPASASIALLPKVTDNPPQEFDFSPAEMIAPRVGTSLGDTPELMDFFTQGGK